MIEIFVYGIGVMYSPGPVNMLGFNVGLNGNFKQSMWFFAGVGAANFTLCILLGYVGQAIVSPNVLPLISIIGCSYILYLAIRMLKASGVSKGKEHVGLNFQDGFIIQVFNPKSSLAVVPITTVMFPAAGVTGIEILFIALAIGILCMWAPGSYSYVGEITRHNTKISSYLGAINKITGILLIVTALAMFYKNVYVPFMSAGL